MILSKTWFADVHPNMQLVEHKWSCIWHVKDMWYYIPLILSHRWKLNQWANVTHKEMSKGICREMERHNFLQILQKRKKGLKNKVEWNVWTSQQALPSSNPLANYHYVYVQYLMVKQIQPLKKLSHYSSFNCLCC